MQKRLSLSMKQVNKLIGLFLVLGPLNFSTGHLLAQEAKATAEPGRMRPVPTAPGENKPALSPERMPARLPGPPMVPPTEVAPARFEAMVYEVQVPEARIAELESSALEAKAGTPQELAKVLGEFGKTKVLYKIDQTVNLYGENITLSTREPIVTDSRLTELGTQIKSFQYQEVGLTINLAANPPGPDQPREKLSVQVYCQLSALAPSEVQISPSTKLVRIRNVRLSHSETPRFGKPLVLFNVSASAAEDKALPVAYVLRYVFREIQP